jgi:signal peptidase I
MQFPLSIIGIGHALWLRRSSLLRPWFSRWFVALPLPLLVSFAIALIVRFFFFQPFDIPGSSLAPTLLVGDYVFVSKTAYGYGRFSLPLEIARRSGSTSKPQRGDIVVFKNPRDNQTDYVKRIVGLPGERIQMTAGVLHIDRTPVRLTAALNTDVPCTREVACHFFRETLPNGRSYIVIDTEENGPGDNTPEYFVPADSYFVMGDNRDNSLDSRFLGEIGPVPEENLIGPVVLIFWNSHGVLIDDRLAGYPDAK